jgi:hypothetical protein
MSVREVIFYEVACDAPDCTVTTADLGGEYAAWKTDDAAIDEWEDGDGVVTEHGKAYCPKHRSLGIEEEEE